MANPFPGVDPYIEDGQLWRDFHVMMLASTRRHLLAVLPPGYDARVEESVSFELRHDDPGRDANGSASTDRGRFPDVAVEQQHGSPADASPGVATATAAAPTSKVRFEVLDDVAERDIRVRRMPDRELVAVIEILSPTNKSAGLRGYLMKRDELIRDRVHLLEIDLLRAGRRPVSSPALPSTPYLALLTRRSPDTRRFVESECWGWGLRDEMPSVPVPLMPGDGEVTLPLKQVYDSAHAEGAYDRAIQRGEAATTTLTGDDAAWAAERHATRWG